MDYFAAVEKRQSVRKYEARGVESAKVQAILEAANRAPSAGNFQSYEIYVVQDESRRRELTEATATTAGNRGMLFNIALNYGGRAEIVDAVRRVVESGLSADALDERRFAEYLYTAGQPDPDLLIRTSGELRVSNFLLWQIAYAEIWVTETLWPDFRCRHLIEGILAYQKRDRRYGGITPGRLAIGAK